MELLPIIYLAYMFVAIYFLALSLLLYFTNKKHLFDYVPVKKQYSVSFVVPAYNEEKTIAETIEHIFAIDYKNILEVIVVNDCSKDNTKGVVESLQKKYLNLILINNKKNLGNAAKTQNVGLRRASGELIAIVDADSYPSPDSLKKMVGFFEDEKVGAVTCPILVRDANTFMEKLQAIEYGIIALTRKLLDFVDGVYVTPGPLAIYRKKALEEVGGFDENNMTQDIEITWHLIQNGWKRKMSLSTHVTTTAPTKIKAWYNQRLRWCVGGLQCISKYKKSFMKRGMLGMFVVPFFILQFFLGVVGLFVFLYVFITKNISNFFYLKYSILTNTPLLTMENFYITPSFLNYLGIILFVCGFIFTLIVLSIMKNTVFKKQSIWSILFFSIVYLTFMPIVSLHSIYKYFKGDYKWR